LLAPAFEVRPASAKPVGSASLALGNRRSSGCTTGPLGNGRPNSPFQRNWATPTGAVSYYLRRAGIPVHPGGSITQHHIDRNELAKLRRHGVSPKEIAERYGRSVTTVERALRPYGLIGGEIRRL
jgi:hypothetical protein